MKVFGIGLSKTGTLSLTKALRILGYKTAHFPMGILALSGSGFSVDATRFDQYDALTDIPVAWAYKKLDRIYAGSKFILTTRDMDSWLRSNHTHYCSAAQWINRPQPYWWDNNKNGVWTKETNLSIHLLLLEIYGIVGFDSKKFKRAYEQHLEEVLCYFKERPNDLLVLDICGGGGWEQLCPFLNEAVPVQPFPRENITRKSAVSWQCSHHSSLKSD